MILALVIPFLGIQGYLQGPESYESMANQMIAELKTLLLSPDEILNVPKGTMHLQKRFYGQNGMYPQGGFGNGYGNSPYFDQGFGNPYQMGGSPFGGPSYPNQYNPAFGNPYQFNNPYGNAFNNPMSPYGNTFNNPYQQQGYSNDFFSRGTGKKSLEKRDVGPMQLKYNQKWIQKVDSVLHKFRVDILSILNQLKTQHSPSYSSLLMHFKILLNKAWIPYAQHLQKEYKQLFNGMPSHSRLHKRAKKKSVAFGQLIAVLFLLPVLVTALDKFLRNEFLTFSS